MYSQIKKTKICCQNHKTRLINILLISKKLSYNEMSSSLKYHQIQSSILGSSKKSMLSRHGPYSLPNSKGIQSLKLRVAQTNNKRNRKSITIHA